MKYPLFSLVCVRVFLPILFIRTNNYCCSMIKIIVHILISLITENIFFKHEFMIMIFVNMNFPINLMSFLPPNLLTTGHGYVGGNVRLGKVTIHIRNAVVNKTWYLNYNSLIYDKINYILINSLPLWLSNRHLKRLFKIYGEYICRRFIKKMVSLHTFCRCYEAYFILLIYLEFYFCSSSCNTKKDLSNFYISPHSADYFTFNM